MIKADTYKEWYDAMGGCNASGLIKAFAITVDEIWEEAKELNQGTDYVNTHPLTQIFADKISQLSAGHNDMFTIYDIVHKRSIKK